MLFNLILIAIVVYSIRGMIFILGAFIESLKKQKQNNFYQPFISVVVPARNEENNIENCLISLKNNNYPQEKFEIIAVNDRSTDCTLEKLEKFRDVVPNLKIVNLTEANKISNLKGKPGALQAGINEAKGEIILMTDADCIVGNNWIETIVNEYSEQNISLVASFTNVIGNRIFDKIQAVEWVYMHTMASAGVGLNQPLGCYGNNLSFRKEEFDKLGGYENISFSVTEDLALLQAMNNSGRQIRYLTHHEADVDTYPCRTLSEYIKQHHRWAIGGMALGWRATLFVVTSAALWIGILLSIISLNFTALVFLIITRLFWDHLIIGISLVKLKKNNLQKWISLSIFFMTIIELIVPFLLLKRNVKWKDQIFSSKK